MEAVVLKSRIILGFLAVVANRMNEAHDAIKKWMAVNRRESAGQSWEIYGDPMPDPSDTETTVVYLLK